MRLRLRQTLLGKRAAVSVGLVAAVVAALLLTQGTDRPHAPRDAGAPAGGAAVPNHPSAPVKEVLQEAKVRPTLRSRLRSRLRASARPVTVRRSQNDPPWAKSGRPASRDRLARRVNPVTSPPFARIAAVDRIVSDEFNEPTLDTSLWTFVNPLGDVGLTMTGSHAELAMQAGVRHDLWTGADEVPRLIQAAPNTDFEVEVNWDSAPSEGYHLQGIIVQQDSDDVLRIETHHDGFGARLFVARIAGGSASVLHFSSLSGAAPTYMRLQRAGSSWTIRTSSDGSTWATAATFSDGLAVSAVGPFAGNSSGGWAPPAYTSRIDYFRALSSVPVDETPPAISGVTSTPSGVGAEVRWQTDEPATSSVAYGSNTSYTGGTVGQQAQVTNHAVTLSGLACGQLYHFQVRSRDAQGNEAVSGDETFTTEACPSSIVSDEFNGQSLNESIWTYADPFGDVELGFTGSQAQLSLPQGLRHDLWSQTDEVPKLLQAAPDTDFEVEAKWDTAPTEGYHLQGILVQQDADDMLRIETHHDGSSQRLFIARIAAGQAEVVHNASFQGPAPVLFRLAREGDLWTLRTSQDGASWVTSATFTESLAVTAIGPFAGNSGWTPPSFTSRIDYFRNVPPDVTAPVIAGIAAEPTGTAATISWTTDEPATSEVRYGRTTSYDAGTLTRTDLVAEHSVSLHGLACDTVYHFLVRGADAAGNQGSSDDRTLTTAPCPAFLQSDEFDGGSLDTSKWTFVDPLGDTSMQLTGGRARFSLPAGVRHDLWTGADEVPRLLQAAPDADFEVEAKFDTQVTTAYQMQGIIVEQDSNDLLRIETHRGGGTNYLFVASIENGVASSVVARSIPASPSFWLKVTRAGGHWTVRFSHDGEAFAVGASFDRAMTVSAVGPFAGNSGDPAPAFVAEVDYFREVTDRTPPEISDIAVTPHSNSAVVTWTTDEPAGSRVAHGPTASYGQIAGATKLDTRHWTRLPDLACGTSYHLQILSADQLGNEATSADRTFTTTPCGGSGGPDIDVWGGDMLTFGSIGVPQRWVNVRGSVYDPQGTTSLRATLNGEHGQNLTVGPDGLRLERQGDFNLELNRDLLLPGDNEVAITAVDGSGNTTTKTVTLDWRGLSAGGEPTPDGPVLAVVAHGDDALLGMAGVIRRAAQEGRRVYVAAATNGDEPQIGDLSGYCGAADGNGATTAARGLALSRETMTAVGLLGLEYSTDLGATELIFLGYPNDSLTSIAQLGGAPWVGGGSGLGRTYGEDDDGDNATCNGELRHLLDGRHSQLTATDLAADFDALLQLTQPSDIYTLAEFDGHPDHSEVARQTVASVRRLGLSTRVHSTLVHPHESGPCMGFSAANWPNPARVDDDPLSRFTPHLDFTAPPRPTCGEPLDFGWGPLGPPTESVEVPPEMQLPVPEENLKWRTLNVWDSQCPPDNPAHVTCGYFNAFAKRNEIFWGRTYTGQAGWPLSYTADWDSTATIPEKAQVIEGEWAYDADRDGVRPIATGFDRLLALGQFDWRSYEVEVPLTLHSFDASKPNAGVGVIMGWQGHTDFGGLQPRFGHPYGGLCGFGRSVAEPAPPQLELIRNNGDNADSVVAAENTPRAISLGSEYRMRFRRVDLGDGTSRYSCKLWRGDGAEPATWDLQMVQPDALATSSQFRGSALLMAHNVDVTFGDAAVIPLD